jgi:hypothetical protein
MYPDTSVVVHSAETDSWDAIPLASIESVSPPDDEGAIEVVYSVRVVSLADGRVAGELRTGETTIDRLFIALGWHSDHDHRRAYTAPLHH